MSKIQWDVPSPHVIELSVQEADIDGLNHTNNAVYVKWCEHAGWAHSEHLGISLNDYHTLDRAMAIRHSEFDYLLPTTLGDTILAATWVSASDGKLSMQRRFQVVRASDGKTVMRGLWDLICIEISSGKPKRMPKVFLDAYHSVVIMPD